MSKSDWFWHFWNSFFPTRICIQQHCSRYPKVSPGPQLSVRKHRGGVWHHHCHWWWQENQLLLRKMSKIWILDGKCQNQTLKRLFQTIQTFFAKSWFSCHHEWKWWCHTPPWCFLTLSWGPVDTFGYLEHCFWTHIRAGKNHFQKRQNQSDFVVFGLISFLLQHFV